MEKFTKATNLDLLLNRLSKEGIAWPNSNIKIRNIPELMKLYIPNEIGKITVFNIPATLESVDKLLLSFLDKGKWSLTQTIDQMKLTQIETSQNQIIAHWANSDFFYITKQNNEPIWLSEWIEYRKKLETDDTKWIF